MLKQNTLDTKIVRYSLYFFGTITAGLTVIPIIVIQGIYLGITAVWETVSEIRT
jgi:hypothetical protein